MWKYHSRIHVQTKQKLVKELERLGYTRSESGNVNTSLVEMLHLMQCCLILISAVASICISYCMPRRFVAGLFRPTPEGEGGINRNKLTRHAIIDLLPIKDAGSLRQTCNLIGGKNGRRGCVCSLRLLLF